jgi:hypothetical protein
MSWLAGSIIAKLVLDSTGFQAGLKAVDSATDKFQKKLGTASDALGNFATKSDRIGRSLSIGVTAPIMAIGGACLKTAMNAIESENLFEVSMGGMAKAARAWSEDLNKRLGLNDYEIRKVIGTFNVMFSSMGVGKEASFDMAKGLSQLTYDMASFYNLKPEEAFQKLQAGISGEIEPLKRLGIVVNETMVQQYAMTQGWIKQGQELTEQQKIMARYNLIIDQTKMAQGDLARTMDSPTNQLRILKGEINKAAIELGMSLIPAFKDVLGYVKQGVEWWKNLSAEKKEFIIKAAGVAAILGPVALLLGRVASMAKLAVLGAKGLVGGFADLGKPLASVKDGLGKLPGIAAAAFVGWQIGKAIGDITGLNTVIEGAATKLINLLGIAKETDVQWQTGHAAAHAKQVEAIGAASDLAGTKVGTFKAAIEVLEAQYKKTGDLGSQTLNDMVKAHLEAGNQAKTHADKVGETASAYGKVKPEAAGAAGSIKDAAKAQEEFNKFLEEAGVKAAGTNPEIEKYVKYGKNLDQMLKDGKISSEDYWKGMTKADEALDSFGLHLVNHLPPARDFKDLIKDFKAPIADAVYGFDNWTDAVQYIHDKFKIATPEIWNAIYALKQMQFMAMGIKLPDIDFTDLENKTKTTVEKVDGMFDGLYNDIARGFGDTFSKFVETWSVDKLMKMDIDFKAFFKDLWGNIKESFFTMVGEMATKWVKSFIEEALVKKTAEAATSVGTSMTTVASSVSSIGTVIASVATAIATVITTLASAVATGIVALATGIASAIVILATAIATAATVLAAAAPALLIVGGIALAIFAGFKAIESLFGGGGGKQSDVTYWLKLIHGNIQEIHDFLLGAMPDYMNSLVSDAIYSKAKLEDISRGIWDSKDFLGPMLAALQSIDSQMSKLKGAQHGMVSTQTQLVTVHGTPSAPEYILPSSDLRTVMEGAAAGGRAGTMIFNANFQIQAIDEVGVRDAVRKKIGPELVAWIKTNIGKKDMTEALGV